MYKSSLLHILNERGFIYQISHKEALDTVLQEKKIPFYWGCDATATSLHVGNLLGLMVMRWAQEEGHTPILLVGGGTTEVGDPSGLDESRQLLSHDQIKENQAGIERCFKKIISFENSRAFCVNNSEWLTDIKLLPFLREIGIHFSLNRMLSFESIKNRLPREQSLSFLELSYMILQGYDFLHLHRHHGCMVQIGGSDQWGNMVSGIDLIRRMTGETVYALTWPLLSTSSGVKMGKTAKGALWLDERKVSPYHYWQFWRNVEDRDVMRFLKLYTMVPLCELKDFSHLSGNDLDKAKIFLADHATSFLHGPDSLPPIHRAVQQTFSCSKKDHEGYDGFGVLPSLEVSIEDIKEGISLLTVLLDLHFVSSRRYGRQKIREGAVRVQGRLIQDELFLLKQEDFLSEGLVKISLGHKNHGLIKIRKE